MELLKSPSGRGLRLGDAMHLTANIGFIGVMALLVFAWQLQVLALVLAVLSKWRILAVRPRYWGINLRANLLDLVFIVSVTLLIINPLAALYAQISWVVLLAVWLLIIKPMTSRNMMIAQAGIAQFVGFVALTAYAGFVSMNQVYLLIIVLGAWVIGYATARHVMSSYESEPKIEFFALAWGLIVAQLAWLFSHWLQIYANPSVPGFEIPQLALLVLLLSFSAQRVYVLQRQLRIADDPHVRRAASRKILKSTYVASAFSISFIVVILLTTNWSITI